MSLSDFLLLLDTVRAGQSMIDETTPEWVGDLLDDLETELNEDIDAAKAREWEKAR